MNRKYLLTTVLCLLLSLIFHGAALAATLKIGLIEEPKIFNPFSATDRWSKNIIRLLYQSLYIKGPRSFEIIPWLAKEKTGFGNENEIVIRIKNALWEDGTPFTAHDVVFTGNIIKEFKVPAFYSDWNFVRDIKALDQGTVKFVLSEKKAIFFSQTILTPIVQKKAWEPVVSRARKSQNPLKTLLEYRSGRIVSNGPFRFSEKKPGHSLIMLKNKSFFGEGMEINGHKIGPHIDAIYYLFYHNIEEMIEALKKGEIDYIWSGVEPEHINKIKKNLQIYLITSPSNSIQYLAFNLSKEPFHDRPLRQTLAYLINKDLIIENIIKNYGVRLDSIIPPGNTKWHAPDINPYGKNLTRKERIRKAVEILRSAGYQWQEKPEISGDEIKYGKGLTGPDGKQIRSFSILIPPFDYDPERAVVAKFIQEWWKEIGLSVELKIETFNSMMKSVKTERDFDVVILGWHLGFDPDYLRTFFHSREAIRYGKNFTNYKNKDFDRLADESALETDFTKRKKLIKNMEHILMGDAAYIPLYSPFTIDAYRLDRFYGWINELDGIGNIWSLLLVKPLRDVL